MDPNLLGALGLFAMIILIALRVPLAFCMGGVGFGGLVLVVGWRPGTELNLAKGWKGAMSFVSFEPYSFVASFPLVAIPLFLLMGFVAFHAGFTRELYNTARIWLAGVRGSLAIASVAGCAMFAAISGSSLATAAAMGRLAVPEMLRYKYDKGLATGVVAAAGTLGSLIPPSILMILYAIFTEESVGRLLLAGIIPGLMTAAIYMIMIWVRVTINPELAPSPPPTTWNEKFVSLKGTWSIIVLFIIVVGGIYTGFVTPTEAAAIGAAGAWVLGFAARRLNRQACKNAITETVLQTANIFAVVLGAKIFVAFITFTGVAGTMAAWAGTLDLPPFLILMALSVIFIILGMFMDPLGIMLLTLPVVTPIIVDMGYDLIWFGVIMVKFLEIGLITPPVGLNVFVLKGVVGDDVKLETIFKGVMWFLAMEVITLGLLIGFPQISLWLPSIAY